jgi:F-type H+-transporting ATPase subunit b
MLTAFAAAAADDKTHSVLIPELPDLIWGSLAFIIILVFFIKKGLPRINAALDARVEAIEGGIKRAEEAQAAANAALERYNAQLKEARVEAAAIRDQAREDAKQIRAELVEQAQADAARIITAAQAQIDVEVQSAFVALRSDVGAIAIDLASGVIGQSLADDKKASALVDQFLADLEASSKAAK